MKYLSICSGIGSEAVAWESLGWKAVGFSETDSFAAAVLAHHYPDITNYGDLNGYEEWELTDQPELIVGGTPCQSFSIAGGREGMDDSRGQLALAFCSLVGRLHPRWFVWENVPGALSAERGSAFGDITRTLSESGYGVGWRVLDAKHFGVPTYPRRRVFVVGHLGDWRPSAAVVFNAPRCYGLPEPGAQRDTPAKKAEGSIDSDGEQEIYTPNLTAKRVNSGLTTLLARCGTGGGNLPFIMARSVAHGRMKDDGTFSTLLARNSKRGWADVVSEPQGQRLRYLSPLECERLHGLPDNHTRIPWRGAPAEQCPFGHRYRVVGNSISVPVLRWLGRRIAMVDELLTI